ncbi:hypothetical protein [Sphingobium sp. Z007]|uniref:hypothetical protein n=1 Tax=Sphingobium sp. Z007 TaxID=627495 RepID=UPI0020CF3BF8|nr:hypothetical protein [Sphingobium sp. Z007]
MSRNKLFALLLLALAALAPGTAMADIFLSANFTLTRGEDPNTYEIYRRRPRSGGPARTARPARRLPPDRHDAPDGRRAGAICL